MNASSWVAEVWIARPLGIDRSPRFWLPGNLVSLICRFMATLDFFVQMEANIVSSSGVNEVALLGTAGQNADQFVAKGTVVFVEGRLQTRQFEDWEGGHKDGE
jgi:single-stranded DNA-binding protein